MEKIELLTALDESREHFLETIDDLPDSALLESGVNDQWSIKDILAHLAMWEAELVKLLWQTKQGKTPNTAHFISDSVDELNAKWYQLNRERTLERILEDFHGVRNQTIQWVEDFSENDLLDTNSFDWLDGTPLWQWIANDSYEHEGEHGAQIRTWRESKGL